MTARKLPHEKLKPGRKPKALALGAPAAVAAVMAATSPVAAADVQPVAVHEAPQPRDALQRHRNVATMPEAELRQYALQVGVSRRDAETLEVGRLRQNCVLVLHALIEDLS